MIDTLYIEQNIEHHPRSLNIINRFPAAKKITCRRYTEIFNRKAQNFRLQKYKPALILAEKQRNFVLPVPNGYGIGATDNFYFSHMMNCPYDCRYCFLQGMYRSAHYVLFVNYENFVSALKAKLVHQTEVHFFSGYDCDSLALEPITGFIEYIVPFFRQQPKALLEMRTKSTQIRTLLNTQPMPNCVVAWSFTPEVIAQALEHKTPTVPKRIKAMLKLQNHGWQIGLRFDPLIYSDEYKKQYRQLFKMIFAELNPKLLHSVSLGTFRLPKDFYQSVRRLYPKALLFASPLEEKKGIVSYQRALQTDMLNYCRNEITRYVTENKLFSCQTI